MAQDAQLISQASKVESLASDGLVSVSTGAGQPQKNMELAKFADSLGSSVPLQQTSEQVSITGLYARTSDGKMVELTKESVASVMAGLMNTNKLFPSMNKGYYTGNLNDLVGESKNGVYTLNTALGGSYENAPSEFGGYGFLQVWSGNDKYGMQTIISVLNGKCYVRSYNGNTWFQWSSIDNFGYNTLAELSSGVAERMGNPAGYKGDKSNIDANTITSSGLYYLNGGITNALEWSYLMVFSFGSANDAVQINTHNSENLTKIRKCAGGTWSSWQTL